MCALLCSYTLFFISIMYNYFCASAYNLTYCLEFHTIHFKVNFPINYFNPICLKQLPLLSCTAKCKCTRQFSLGINNPVTGYIIWVRISMKCITYCSCHSFITSKLRYLSIGRNTALRYFLYRFIYPFCWIISNKLVAFLNHCLNSIIWH